MEFRWLYEGPLKANRGPTDKQTLRREFHRQLRELVGRKPLGPFKRLVEAKHVRSTVLDVGSFQFVPLITEKLQHVAHLHITFLTPDEPGLAVTKGGDLDNRLKTLLDALRAPKSVDELPRGDQPGADETPFYCLLEDDALISGLSVTADRLLRPVSDASQVFLVIHVVPQSTESSIGEVRWSDI